VVEFLYLDDHCSTAEKHQMTEADWLRCSLPEPMLWWWGDQWSERKVRLFLCACARKVEHLLTSEAVQVGIEVAEWHADHLASEEERKSAYSTLMTSIYASPISSTGDYSLMGGGPASVVVAIALKAASESIIDELTGRCLEGGCAGGDKTYRALGGCHYCLAAYLSHEAWINNERRKGVQRLWHSLLRPVQSLYGEFFYSQVASAYQKRVERLSEPLANLVRDVVGNPFRPPRLDRSRLNLQVISLARTIYEQKRFESISVLGDALEEAGCEDEGILSHCRQPAEHVKGCWLLDLLLQME
jgi:hypothetical protein